MIFDDLVQNFLGRFTIKPITTDNIDDAFHLVHSNDYFVSRTQFHPLSIDDCLQDIIALPPNTDMSQKHYLGFYDGPRCAALLEYIEGYPDAATVFIGFFIIDSAFHGQKIGSSIIGALSGIVRKNGFSTIRLGCYDVNEIGKIFWRSQGFSLIDERERDIEGHMLKYGVYEKSV